MKSTVMQRLQSHTQDAVTAYLRHTEFDLEQLGAALDFIIEAFDFKSTLNQPSERKQVTSRSATSMS